MNKKILIAIGLVPFIILMLDGAKANAISAEFMDSNFETIIDIPDVKTIEAWEQPKTQYTPKNLRSEYQIRYSGTNAQGRGSYSYTTHFTDYDTYITGNGITQDGKYYVRDNTGKGFITGEVAKDYDEPINQLQQNVSSNTTNINNNAKRINDNTRLINNNSKQINSVNNRVNGLSSQVSGLSDRVDTLDNRINNLDSKMKQGFATVTALTSLHPNPRSNEKLEVSIGTGIYQDTFAGAIGLFYHPNDRVQIYAGGAYGGHDSWAGGAGITFGIGRSNK